MGGNVGDVVRLPDHTVGPDQVGITTGVLLVLLARLASDVVLRTDLAIDIAQQSEREVLVFREGEILVGRVERRAEDDDVEFVEAVGLVTKALTLNRSTRRGGLRVPPHQHPLAGEVAEAHGLAVLVGQFEVGRFRPWAEHPVIVSATYAGGATARSLTQLPWNPNGTRCGSGTRAT